MYHEKLTKKDVERLQEEIDHRKLVVRKEAIEAVKEARAQGDLSENFEYYAAKRDKNKNESRIRYLERMIKNAEIITDNSREDEVGLNNLSLIHISVEKPPEPSAAGRNGGTDGGCAPGTAYHGEWKEKREQITKKGKNNGRYTDISKDRDGRTETGTFP